MARHPVPRRWTSPRRPHGACPAQRPACASTRSGGCVSEPKASGTPRTSPTGGRPVDFDDSDLFRAVVEPEDQGTDDAGDSSPDVTGLSWPADDGEVLGDGHRSEVAEVEAHAQPSLEVEEDHPAGAVAADSGQSAAAGTEHDAADQEAADAGERVPEVDDPAEAPAAEPDALAADETEPEADETDPEANEAEPEADEPGSSEEPGGSEAAGPGDAIA